MAKDFGKVSRRYARALLEVCAPLSSSGPDLETTNQALRVSSEVWDFNSAVRSALHNPAIPLTRRLELLREQAEILRPGDSVFSNFLCVLLQNDRLAAIGSISRSFQELVDGFKKVLSLEITSAFTLEDAEKRRIDAEIQKGVASNLASFITIRWSVDTDILGGLQVKAGDKLLDASVAGRLNQIGRELSQVAASV